MEARRRRAVGLRRRAGELARSSWAGRVVSVLCSWNSASLFGGLWSRVGRVSAKRRFLSCLLELNSVVVVLEARGVHVFHGYEGGFLPTDDGAASRAGGIFVAVSRDLLRRVRNVVVHVQKLSESEAMCVTWVVALSSGLGANPCEQQVRTTLFGRGKCPGATRAARTSWRRGPHNKQDPDAGICNELHSLLCKSHDKQHRCVFPNVSPCVLARRKQAKPPLAVHITQN